MGILFIVGYIMIAGVMFDVYRNLFEGRGMMRDDDHWNMCMVACVFWGVTLPWFIGTRLIKYWTKAGE